jgi:N6-adenosine-specific RNA methylase IME4
MASRQISDIIVRTRHRKDMGDLEALARSIEEVGLLHPVVVDRNNVLIAGDRRLRAIKRFLGWDSVPVHVVDLEKVVRGELAENTIRKDFTPSELVAVGGAIEALERAEAKKRQAHGGPRSGRLPERSKGQVRDKIAVFGGVSGRTFDKAKAIVRAAEADPKTFGKLKEDIDRTGNVNGPYKRLKIGQQSAAIRKEPPPLPGRGPYRVIVADPPWPYERRDEDPSHRAVLPYPTMSIEQICAINVAWVTNHHLREAFTVLDAWGFVQMTMLTWAKDKMGFGDWLRGQTEQCMLAIRGKPVVRLTNETTLLQAPMRAHSQKPDEFYEMVERLCPAPRYATLFHRGPTRLNWDGHGDELATATGTHRL